MKRKLIAFIKFIQRAFEPKPMPAPTHRVFERRVEHKGVVGKIVVAFPTTQSGCNVALSIEGKPEAVYYGGWQGFASLHEGVSPQQIIEWADAECARWYEILEDRKQEPIFLACGFKLVTE